MSKSRSKTIRYLGFYGQSGNQLQLPLSQMFIVNRVAIRWLLKLQELLLQLEGFDHIYIQTRISVNVLSEEFKVGSPVERGTFYVEIPCECSRFPVNTFFLVPFLDRIIYEALKSLKCISLGQVELLEKAREYITSNGDNSFSRIHQVCDNSYSVEVLLRTSHFESVFSEAYLRTTNLETGNSFTVPIFSYLRYFEVKKVFHNLVLKSDKLIVEHQKKWLTDYQIPSKRLSILFEDLFSNRLSRTQADPHFIAIQKALLLEEVPLSFLQSTHNNRVP